MMIIKNRTATGNWSIYHIGLGNTRYSVLNTAAVSTVAATAWNNTTPTGTVFSVGSGVTNPSGGSMTTLLFADVAGQVATGSTPGAATVTTGFRPKVIWVKVDAAASPWYAVDTLRGIDRHLQLGIANTTEATGSTVITDVTETGFTIGIGGGTVLYIAFA
jgi:hypothetical protein